MNMGSDLGVNSGFHFDFDPLVHFSFPLDSFSSLGFGVFFPSGACPLGRVPSSDHFLKLSLSSRALPLSQGRPSDSLTGSLDPGGSCVEVDWCESVNSVMKWNPYRGPGFAWPVFDSAITIFRVMDTMSEHSLLI